MKIEHKRIPIGFTLIEVIITLVVLAILAAMMAPYFGTSLTRSGSSIFNLQKTQELNQVMERISARYSEIPRWRKDTFFPSGVIVLSSAAAPNQGRFSSGGGTSGSTEPSWNNISAGATTTDNTITWTYVGPSPELTALQTAIGTEGQNYDNSFGRYHLVSNHFVTFNSATKVEEVCDATCSKYGIYLKVTIGYRTDDANRTGETLTALFVRR